MFARLPCIGVWVGGSEASKGSASGSGEVLLAQSLPPLAQKAFAAVGMCPPPKVRSRFDPGRKRIWVGFIICSLLGGKSQPRFVIKAFGEKGENMKGGLVDNLGKEKIAEVADTFS